MSSLGTVEDGRLLDRPVFIVGAPRSGTTMLFTLLSALPRLFSLRAEAHEIWWQGFHPAERGWQSDVLTAADATPEAASRIARAFYDLSVPNRSVFARFAYAGTDMDQAAFVERFAAYTRERNDSARLLRDVCVDPAHPMEQALEAMKQNLRPLRFVEKTPRNCLHVGFIDALFPDALFVYIKRDGRANVSSLMEGWRMPRHDIYYDVPRPARIPGVETRTWVGILPPGWQDYVDRPLEEVATFQWMESNRIAMDDLARIAPERVHSLFYEDLVDNTEIEMRALARFVGVRFGRGVEVMAEHPPVVAAITPPEQDKWRRQNGELIERMTPRMLPLMREMGYRV